MKNFLSNSGYVRATGFSLLAGFALLTIVNSEEVSAAFHTAAGFRKDVRSLRSASSSATPAVLRVPEGVAAAIGKIWSWLN